MLEIEKFYRSYKFNFKPKDIIEKNNNRYMSIDHDGLMFIRDFCQEKTKHIDIDEYYSEDEIKQLNENIIVNNRSLNSGVNYAKYNHYQYAILVGSNIKKEELELLDKNKFLVVGVNQALKVCKDKLKVYICNNPYKSSLDFIPNDIVNEWPEGIFSYKIYPKFLKFYKGPKLGYNLPELANSNGPINLHAHHCCLEDHRNSVLAALNFLYNVNVKRIILLGVENYLKEERPGSINISKNVWMYPQQIIEMSMLSAASFWLKEYGINVYTNDRNIDFVDYIKVVEE